MNIFQTQMDLSNEVKQLSPVKLPRYDVEGEKIHICKIFDFESMIDDYMVELEIRNYSQNTIKTYHSISKRRREALHRETVLSHFQEIHTDLETGKACDTELHIFKHCCMQKIPGIS